ncbi:hypothetical protein C7447_101764 [Tenacibaculum adriaticum]|uniref:GTP-binding protein n=1 Tax=Tenacibaculum adriaticum TaxID=413713 RepID=A0A5S5DWP5_9FLAO|nr:ABC transporter ATP-binding protein [Tenacibaculum adriaticum]TYQ00155.1 hypothetical protein C7447_101764 [Tenacibaculum adriaticum]
MNRREEQNSEIFLRPRFSIMCERKATEVMHTLLSNLKENKKDFKTRISDNHIFIDIPEKETHFWSPQLHFEVVEDEGKTKIKGLFGPKPQVWTLFMFVHFFVATAFIGFTIMFYVKNKFGESVVFPLVMLVVLPIIWFLLYFLGQFGKQTGKNQMDDLKNFMKDILENIN